MDLSTVLSRIDLHQYGSVKEFLQDVDLIWQNALEYNPDRDPSGTHSEQQTHTHAHTPWLREGSVKYKCSPTGWLECKCLYFLRSSDTAQSMCTERHSPCYHQRWTGWRFWEALWGDQGVTQRKRSVCVSMCVCTIIDICPGPMELERLFVYFITELNQSGVNH